MSCHRAPLTPPIVTVPTPERRLARVSALMRCHLARLTPPIVTVPAIAHFLVNGTPAALTDHNTSAVDLHTITCFGVLGFHVIVITRTVSTSVIISSSVPRDAEVGCDGLGGNDDAEERYQVHIQTPYKLITTTVLSHNALLIAAHRPLLSLP